MNLKPIPKLPDREERRKLAIGPNGVHETTAAEFSAYNFYHALHTKPLLTRLEATEEAVKLLIDGLETIRPTTYSWGLYIDARLKRVTEILAPYLEKEE